MNLYHLDSRLQQLLDKEEYTPEEMLELESLYESREDECISRGKHIRNMEAELAAVESAINDMKIRALWITKNIVSQNEKLIDRMKSANIEKITKSPLFPIIIKKNPPMVEIYDHTALPKDFIREKVVTSYSPDKESIKNAINDGETVAGARIIQNYRISFKQGK